LKAYLILCPVNQPFNETQATGIPMKRDELELAGRIIPKAKRRDTVGSNSPPLGAHFLLDTPLLAAG